MDRRKFLSTSAATAALSCTSTPSLALQYSSIYVPPTPQIAGVNTSNFWQKDRTLWLRRTVGKRVEEFRVTYWGDGELDIKNYVLLCHILRDVNEDQTVVMNPLLLDLLYGLTAWQELELGKPVPALIHSGYRTEKTNRSLEKAADNSKHKIGDAADKASPYYSHETIARMAEYFGMGGVGRYDTHTHVDVWHLKLRRWDYRSKASSARRQS